MCFPVCIIEMLSPSVTATIIGVPAAPETCITNEVDLAGKLVSRLQ